MNNMNFQNFLPQHGYKYDLKGDENVADFRIRPVRAEDSYLINELRIMEGVFENIPSVYSERVNFSHNLITGLSGESDHVFVAEGKINNCPAILGMAGLHGNKNPRQRHSATIGIMVHPAYQGKGIGKKLMDKLIDLADNWISIKRIELEVISDNTPAINLYKKYGFREEGVKKHCVMCEGKYKDATIMARCKI